MFHHRKRPSSVAVWMGQMHVSENDDKIGMRRRLRQPTREVETCLDHVICVPMSTWSLLTSFPLALKDIYMNLLTISFVALSWKDTNICHRTASMICWNLLRQVAHV